MRERIQAMRKTLHAVLAKKMPARNFDYFLTQRGMFSYTGLSPEQVDRLREEFAVYLSPLGPHVRGRAEHAQRRLCGVVDRGGGVGRITANFRTGRTIIMETLMTTVEEQPASPPKTPVMHPEEWQARVQLAACYRIFAMLGWTEMIYNHITVRAARRA